MKKTNTYINQYNSPNTVVMIGTYPEKDNRSIQHLDAIASYTDHLTGSLSRELKTRQKKLVILAQKKETEDWYQEKGVLVGRVWEKGSPQSFINLIKTIRKLSHVTDILIQFEFHEFGGIYTTVFFPLFVMALRLIGKRVHTVLHQVIEDITDLSGHVNIYPNTLKAFQFNTALRLFYTSVCRTSTTIIVHHAVLAERLRRMTIVNLNVRVVPHGLGAIKQQTTKEQARRKLKLSNNDFVVMSFGFLTWYKGSDWLVSQWKNIAKDKNMKLIMAGGTSPNVSKTKHYQSFVKKIYASAQKDKRITITGFVDDTNIATYFAAADVVVLPYRSLMSSSGPMAMAIAFNKAFLISDSLSDYTKDQDINKALELHSLSNNDIVFPLEAKKLAKKLQYVQQNIKTFESIASHVKQYRQWTEVSKQFADVTEPNLKQTIATRIQSTILSVKKAYAYATEQIKTDFPISSR